MTVKKAGAHVKYAGVVLILLMGAALIGCAVIENVPTPDDVLKHPLGSESIKIGMTKEQVEDLWGRPNDIRMIEDKARWGASREMWVYNAQYGSVPVDAGYLSKSKKLYFDGNNLTNIGE